MDGRLFLLSIVVKFYFFFFFFVFVLLKAIDRPGLDKAVSVAKTKLIVFFLLSLIDSFNQSSRLALFLNYVFTKVILSRVKFFFLSQFKVDTLIVF